MRKRFIALLLTASLAVPLTPVYADAKDDRIAELEAKIQEMQQTIDELQANNFGAEPSAATDNPQSKEKYDVTYQNISFYQDAINTLWAQAIVEVTNTGNCDLYLNYSSYELVSETGTMIHTNSNSFPAYPQVISPGEKGYYYEEVMMDTGTPTEGISITPHISTSASKISNARLEVSNTEVYDKEFGSIDLHGKIKNTTGVEQSNIGVTAILFNSEKKPIGQLHTMLMDTLPPNEERGFELEAFSLPPDITKAAISEYVVYAYPIQYQY